MNGTQSAPLSEKAKIVLPIAASVIALFVFMILVWPTGPHGGKHGKQARTDRVAAADRHVDDTQGAGWRPDASERGATRNRQATEDGAGPGSPRKEHASRSSAPKGETWWYHQDGTVDHSADKGGWWYH